VFDNSAQNPGTYPDCGQRSYLLINYDSTLDRNDGTPCDLDGFVDFAGASPMTGNTVTPGGNTFPGFFNSVNFPGFPGGPWTSANGPVNWTHYIPAGPSPYTNMPRDRKGFVTVGIILGSGCLNPNANPPCTLPACLSDTVWYHNFFQFITLDASYTYRKVGGYSAYGNPSRLPSQDYTYDTAQFFSAINPTAPPPFIFAANGAFRQPWSRLFGKGDILQFDPTTKQQDYILADVWAWGVMMEALLSQSSARCVLPPSILDDDAAKSFMQQQHAFFLLLQPETHHHTQWMKTLMRFRMCMRKMRCTKSHIIQAGKPRICRRPKLTTAALRPIVAMLPLSQ
jgi:hypothetical protein